MKNNVKNPSSNQQKQKMRILITGGSGFIGTNLINYLSSKEKAEQVLNGCLQDGLLMILSGEDGNVIRTHFPLSISDDDLEIGMSIIEKHLLE